jgi:predicted phosphatase
MTWFVSSTNMQELKAEKPLESTEGSDPVSRLIERILAEGFTTDQSEEEWESFGEIIYRRTEKISFATGETVFIFTRVPDLTERVLRQASESVVKSWQARNVAQKALSVLQSRTVYHCLVAPGDQPHNDSLVQFIARAGGATFIPIVIVPDINQVIYPDVEEKIGSVKPRIEYFRYLIGERREPVDMHRPTLQAMWVSMAVVALLLIAIVVSFFH